MKIYTLFLVALIAFVFAAPADAQRRKREAQQQTQSTKTEQTTPSGNGRRERETNRKPSVPCTLPIQNSPSLRGLALNMTAAQVDLNFSRNIYFNMVAGRSFEDSFINSFDFYALETPRKTVIESLSKEDIARAEQLYQQMHPKEYAQMKEAQRKAEEEKRNAPNTPKPTIIRPGDLIKKMSAAFYGRGNGLLYNYQILYRDDLAFENVEAIQENLSENLKIPVGSWVQIPDPEYIRKLIGSSFALLNFQFVSPNDVILRQAECNGWRAVFVTSTDYTGLAISIINSSVADNMDQLVAQDKKAINDAQKQRTTKIFKP